MLDDRRQPTPRSERASGFAELISMIRTVDKHWTVEQLADKSGVPAATIEAWEMWDARFPDPNEVIALCEALNIDPSYAALALGHLRPEGLPEPTNEQFYAMAVDPVVASPAKLAAVKYLRTRKRV